MSSYSIHISLSRTPGHRVYTVVRPTPQITLTHRNLLLIFFPDDLSDLDDSATWIHMSARFSQAININVPIPGSPIAKELGAVLIRE